MKKNLLFLTALLISVMGFSQTIIVQDSNNNTLQFSVTSSSTVSLTGGNTIINVNVDIPGSVSDGGTTYIVTGINAQALGNKSISSVSLPNSITSIGQQAFSQNNLTSIVLPSGLTTIGNYAFQNNQLQGLTIPNNVTNIGDGVFRGNPLSTVTSLAATPPSITTEAGNNDSFAQGGNRSGIDLIIPAGTTGAYVTDTGAMWTGFNTVTENLNVGDTYISNFITYQVTSVGSSTVKAVDYNTTGGTVVNIPATVPNGLINYSVTEIGNNAFLSNNLTSVTIPDSVITIGQGAFNNNSINSLTLGNSLEIIGNWSFQSNNLTSVTIPNSVTSIAMNAFRFNNITTLNLGNSVETIGNSAFTDNNISSLVIPDSVLTIGDYAFTYSDNMTNLVIGNNVTSIGDFAFAMNPSLAVLTSVVIPSSVLTIGEYAFSIASLTDVTSLATTPPTIVTGGTTTDTFSIYRSNISLHLPTGTTGAYVTDPGALWTGFNSVAEDASLSTSNFEIENGIKIITNKDELKIISSGSAKLKNYGIYSITGSKVKKGTENTIEINTLSNGIYILELTFDTGKLVKKFAK